VAKELPDFRAAAIISDAITKILPGAYCDIGTLMAEAKIIEENIKKIRENQSHVVRWYLHLNYIKCQKNMC
jgi:predicted ATP-grasp superfamily ATP-dependent carboligase